MSVILHEGGGAVNSAPTFTLRSIARMHGANFPDLVRDIAHIYSLQVSDGPRGSKQMTFAGHYVTPHTVELSDLDEQRLAMDRADIDLQVLSAPP